MDIHCGECVYYPAFKCMTVIMIVFSYVEIKIIERKLGQIASKRIHRLDFDWRDSHCIYCVLAAAHLLINVLLLLMDRSSRWLKMIIDAG